MKNLKLRNLSLMAVCLAAFATAAAAGAQSVKHDVMDARAARADLARLQRDRKHAVRTKNWGKVKQDDRLIATDRYWMRKDIHKAKRGG